MPIGNRFKTWVACADGWLVAFEPLNKRTRIPDTDESMSEITLKVSWSKTDNPLTPRFSPSLLDNASLSDKPCLRIYFGLERVVVVLAVNWVTLGTLATI